MFDCVVVFDKGIVQQFDIVDCLYELLCNEFVVNFIGDSNWLCGIIVCVDGEFCEFWFDDGMKFVGCYIGEVVEGVFVVVCICFECMSFVVYGVNGMNGGVVNCVSGEVCSFIYFGDYVCMCCVLLGQDECFVKVLFGIGVFDVFLLGVLVLFVFLFEYLCVFV